MLPSYHIADIVVLEVLQHTFVASGHRYLRRRWGIGGALKSWLQVYWLLGQSPGRHWKLQVRMMTMLVVRSRCRRLGRRE